MLGRTYYIFLGVHSFLIGLFPFFLPVYLVKSGHTLADVCWFIGITGLGFCCSLAIWERACSKCTLRFFLLLSFLLELILVCSMAAGFSTSLLPLLALINGAYNCLFWMIQRILFFMTSDAGNSGRKFGDFQIFVMVVLKSGIFTGGLLLDRAGTVGIILLSLTSIGVAIFLLQRIHHLPELPGSLKQSTPWQLKEFTVFSDTLRSRLIFAIDGIFLYVESYFWLISMFFLVQQSFWQLSLLVIALAIVFSLLFYCIKNRIDTFNTQRAYSVGVLLYALSWVLRSQIDPTSSGASLYLMLILITFSTSYFRLTFNKRFFDNARATSAYRYICYKSYVSQIFIGLFFCLIAVATVTIIDVQPFLQKTYLLAGVLALLYLAYRSSPATDEARVQPESGSLPLESLPKN